MFDDIAKKKDGYNEFNEQFGQCLKLGVREDFSNRTQIADIVRFHSSNAGDANQEGLSKVRTAAS